MHACTLKKQKIRFFAISKSYIFKKNLPIQSMQIIYKKELTWKFAFQILLAKFVKIDLFQN